MVWVSHSSPGIERVVHVDPEIICNPGCILGEIDADIAENHSRLETLDLGTNRL